MLFSSENAPETNGHVMQSPRSVMEQHRPDIAFEYLEKINWANNLQFYLSGFRHLFANPINSIQLASMLLNNYVHDINSLFDEFGSEPEQVSTGFRESGLIILDAMPQFIQGIRDSSEKLNQFLSLLAEFTGKGVIAASSDLDFNRLVSLCVSMAQHQISAYTNSFRLDVASDLPILPGNAQQIAQAILNLLMNALISLPDRSCEIILAVSCNRASGSVQMCVKDEGVGIHPDILPHVDTPFFSTWHKHGCMGLGLTVADRIVRDHGGELFIDTEYGKGTRVSVSLPLYGPEKADDCHAECYHA